MTNNWNNGFPGAVLSGSPSTGKPALLGQNVSDRAKRWPHARRILATRRVRPAGRSGASSVREAA